MFSGAEHNDPDSRLIMCFLRLINKANDWIFLRLITLWMEYNYLIRHCTWLFERYIKRVAWWSSSSHAELSFQRSGVQIPVMVETSIVSRFLLHMCPSILSYDEYTSRKLSVGWWDGRGEDWSQKITWLKCKQDISNLQLRWYHLSI